MKRRDLLQGGSLVLLLGAAQIARGANIVAVRVWPAPEYSRVTIESDTKLSSKQIVMINPPRLAVDIDGLTLNGELRELVGKVRADDPFIAGIRASQQSPGVVRLLVDLKQSAGPQVFTLQPVAAYQQPLVFDFYPAKEADPLEALINERMKEKDRPRVSPPAASPLASSPALPAGPQ
ncbi:MAG: AMIN domain-containing protein, partial [Ramlibacter sp.]|nr:AMIN domain-containing protein [Ramlibacter sp.]